MSNTTIAPKQMHSLAEGAPHERDIAGSEEASARIAAISAQGLATTLVYADEAYLNKILLTPHGSRDKSSAEGLQGLASRIGEMQNLAPAIAIAVADVENFEKDYCAGKPPYSLNADQTNVAEQLLVQGIVLRRQFIDLLAQIKDVSPDFLTSLLKNISNPIKHPATKEARLATLSINEESLSEIKGRINKTIDGITSREGNGPKTSAINASAQQLGSQQNNKDKFLN